MTDVSGDLQGGENDPPKEVVVGFWTIVLFVKVAVLALGLGSILLVATEFTILGLALIGVGGYVIIRGMVTYRRLKRQHDLG